MASLLMFFVRSIFARKEQILSPLMFALALVLLFSATAANLEPEQKKELFMGMSPVIALIVTSWFFMRLFSYFEKERVIETVLLIPQNPLQLFTALFLPTFVLSWGSSLFMVLAFGQFLGVPLPAESGFWIMVCFALYLLALTSLGILCSVLTTESTRNNMLFPMVYFPLAVPLTLVSMQSVKVLLQPVGSAEFSSLHPAAVLLFLALFFYGVSALLFAAVIE